MNVLFSLKASVLAARAGSCGMEGKYPTMSPLKEIVGSIQSQVAKIEDDMKVGLHVLVSSLLIRFCVLAWPTPICRWYSDINSLARLADSLFTTVGWDLGAKVALQTSSQLKYIQPYSYMCNKMSCLYLFPKRVNFKGAQYS